MLVCNARSRSGRAMISVPELIVARSIPRLVHDKAHHLYCSCSAWTPILRRRAVADSIAIEQDLNVNVRFSVRASSCPEDGHRGVVPGNPGDPAAAAGARAAHEHVGVRGLDAPGPHLAVRL